MEKRTIAAIALSVLVLIAFQLLQRGRLRQATAPRAPAPISAESPPPPSQHQEVAAEKVPQPVSASAADTKATSQTIVVEGELYRAVLDNRGALLTGWQLNEYKSAQGRIFEMIAGNNASSSPSLSGSVIFEDKALTELSNNELYQVSIEGGPDTGNSLRPPVTVVFMLKRGDLAIEKRYRFEKENYLFDLSATFTKGGIPIAGRFLVGEDIGPEQEHLLNKSSALEAVYYQNGKVHREGPPKEAKEIKRIEGALRWIGLSLQYFTVIEIPPQTIPYFEIQKRPVKTMGLDGKEVDRDLLRVTIPMDGSIKHQFYLGPKKQSNLEAVKSVDIGGVINYGMFSILVRPLLISLIWIHQFVQNYGAAIIILTFLLTLLLFPFRLKQMISMKKMQVVQPKVKAIQEKYRRYKKTDPKRAEMNQEIMALYKEHNVNPLGGCLPLVLQFPLLFAFYALLQYSIELRQAPFIGWIHDLSVKDPYYVLPIVMGITMLISQKMTPMTPGTDPTQTKMMMMMPAVFTLMFLNVMSGLNLYFLCSNIFQIAFQKIAQGWIGDGQSNNKAKSP